MNQSVILSFSFDEFVAVDFREWIADFTHFFVGISRSPYS